jgi:hypothetical protein
MTSLDRLPASRPAGFGVMWLAILLIAPVTLAHASLPDPTWLEGVYDQADFDDVVGLLTSSLEATGSPAAPEAGACLVLVLTLCPARAAGPASVPAYSAPLRAPPIP